MPKDSPKWCPLKKRRESLNYYKKFEEIHDLLKNYNCKSTFSWEKEYTEGTDLLTFSTDIFFYKPLNTDKENNKEWEEDIVAKLDVVIPTKIREAEKQEIRFDISYSDKVKKYSMYISLPTSGRSVPLSKNIYSIQDEVIREINKYIEYVKARRGKAKPKKNIEQISFFK